MAVDLGAEHAGSSWPYLGLYHIRR